MTRIACTILLATFLVALTETAFAQAAETLIGGLRDIYLLLKNILILLSVISLTAIAAYAYRGQFPWGWLVSLGFSLSLLLLAPNILEHLTDLDPLAPDIADPNPALSAALQQHESFMQRTEFDQPAMSDDDLRYVSVLHHCYNVHDNPDDRQSCPALDWQPDSDNTLLTLPSSVFRRVCTWLYVCTERPTIRFNHTPP